MSKTALQLDFYEVVPVVLPTGTVYIKSLQLIDEVQLDDMEEKDRVIFRLMKQVCDESGKTYLTKEEAGRVPMSVWLIIHDHMVELTAKQKKSLLPSQKN